MWWLSARVLALLYLLCIYDWAARAAAMHGEGSGRKGGRWDRCHGGVRAAVVGEVTNCALIRSCALTVGCTARCGQRTASALQPGF